MIVSYRCINIYNNHKEKCSIVSGIFHQRDSIELYCESQAVFHCLRGAFCCAASLKWDSCVRVA